MRRSALALGALCAALTASSASAQLAIAARAGTTGVGGEVALGVSSRFGLRGGIGVIPVKPTFTFDDIEYEVDPPSPLITAGADLYLTNSIRLFGGILFGADKLEISGPYSQSVTFGDRTYTGSGTISGSVETSSTAPFVGLGFGKTFGSGIGLLLDLGGAILGKSDVTIAATGPVAQASDYEQQRAREEENIQEDVDKYVKVLPMISLGLRIGLGR